MVKRSGFVQINSLYIWCTEEWNQRHMSFDTCSKANGWSERKRKNLTKLLWMFNALPYRNLFHTRKYLERSSRCNETLKRRAFIRLLFILPFSGERLNATTKKVKGKGIVCDDEVHSRVLDKKNQFTALKLQSFKIILINFGLFQFSKQLFFSFFSTNSAWIHWRTKGIWFNLRREWKKKTREMFFYERFHSKCCEIVRMVQGWKIFKNIYGDLNFKRNSKIR